MPRSAFFRIIFSAAILTVILVTSNSWAASTVTTVYNFTGGLDGSDPASQLIFDNAGNAYGTAVTGGASGCGTVFQLTPMGGGQYQQSVLHSFNCFDEGKNPYGGVTLDSAGNLYGTTVAGGSGGVCTGDGCGVVYKLTHSGGSWTESVLYSFGDSPDAGGPGSAVVFDHSGNLFGTAPDGGAYGVGAVFELSLVNGQWTERVIHDFTGGDDGATGFLGRLLPDTFGNFYGVTELGGANAAGTVFKLTPGSGGTYMFSTLYAFAGQPDGAFPYGGLIADSHGNLYGTTYYGGAYGAGAVFRVGPTASFGGWRDAVLYSFQGGPDGGNPTTTLVFTPNGRLYGTTAAGGDPGCDCGVIFSLAPTGVNRWLENVLHTFGTPPDGAYPYYGLTPDGAGHYLGTTAAGGTQGAGILFQLTP